MEHVQFGSKSAITVSYDLYFALIVTNLAAHNPGCSIFALYGWPGSFIDGTNCSYSSSHCLVQLKLHKILSEVGMLPYEYRPVLHMECYT